MPDISLIIPAYNAAATLTETLDSVLAQTCPPDQIIVIDDGSQDATAETARGHTSRPQVISQANGGVGASFNLGLRHATGDLIAFLDADDLWATDKLQIQRDYLQAHPDIDGVLGQVTQFLCPTVPKETAATLRVDPEPQPGWLCGALLMRHEMVGQIGPFSEDLRSGTFIDWMDRAKASGARFHVLDDIVFRRRMRAGTHGARNARSDQAMLEMARRAIARRRGQSD